MSKMAAVPMAPSNILEGLHAPHTHTAIIIPRKASLLHLCPSHPLRPQAACLRLLRRTTQMATTTASTAPPTPTRPSTAAQDPPHGTACATRLHLPQPPPRLSGGPASRPTSVRRGTAGILLLSTTTWCSAASTASASTFSTSMTGVVRVPWGKQWIKHVQQKAGLGSRAGLALQALEIQLDLAWGWGGV